MPLNGVVVLVLAWLVYWLMKRVGRACWLDNNFAGSAIRRAQAKLEDIVRFERERRGNPFMNRGTHFEHIVLADGRHAIDKHHDDAPSSFFAAEAHGLHLLH